MLSPRRLALVATVVAAATIISSCAVQLVAPYDAELQRRASSMQADVAAWDLTMRGAAGTIAADPRNPDVVAMINKWRGEADAMLTLAVSNDPNVVSCSEAVKAVDRSIESAIPLSLRAPTQSSAPAQASPLALLGCEATLVADVETGIDDVEKGLKYCKVPWIEDAYFTRLAENRTTAPAPPKAPTIPDQSKLTSSCLFEFEANPQMPAKAAGARHGRAVSNLLETLAVIVYIENRKKAAQASK
jgi:hypothetical protein